MISRKPPKRISKKALSSDLPTENVLSLRRKVLIIEFSKEAFNKYFSKYKHLLSPIATILFVLVAGTLILKSHAEVTSLYSTKCLGNWENSHNAEGEPDVAKGEDFSAKNSAIFNNTKAQIFCGGFHGTIPEEGNPEKVVVKFSWTFADELITEKNDSDIFDNQENTSTQINTDETNTDNTSAGSDTGSDSNSEDQSGSGTDTESSTEDTGTTDTGTDTNTDTGSSSEDQSTTEDVQSDPAPESNGDSINLFESIFPKAFAEEGDVASDNGPADVPSDVASEEAPVDSSAEEHVLPETDTEVLEVDPSDIEEVNPSDVEHIDNIEPVDHGQGSGVRSDAEVISIDDIKGTKEEEVIKEAPNDFLEVLYTLDGSDWKTLGFVSVNNWKQASFEISDPQVVLWQDLSNLQISVRSIQKIDKQPIVYLDSIYIEVEYLNKETTDPNPQPDLAAESTIYDETFGDIRIIKIVRDEKAQIWYAKIPPLKTLPSDSLVVLDAQSAPDSPEVDSENPKIHPDENIQVEEVPSETEIKTEDVPVVPVPSHEDAPDSARVVDTLEDKDVPLEDTVAVEVPTGEVVDISDIQKELDKTVDQNINPSLVWSLVAGGGSVSLENVLAFNDNKIFFIDEAKSALYVFSLDANSISSTSYNGVDNVGGVNYIDYKNDVGGGMRAILNSGVFEFESHSQSLLPG